MDNGKILSLLDRTEKQARQVLHEVLTTDYLQEVQQDLPTPPPCLDRESTKESQIRSIRKWYVEQLRRGKGIECFGPSELKFFIEIQKWESALNILPLSKIARTLLKLDNIPTEALALVMFEMGFETGTMFGYRETTHPHIMQAWRSMLASMDMKGKHRQDNIEKEILLAKFEGYVTDKIAEGYKGNSTTLVRRALNRPELADLSDAVATKFDDKGQITKRAFIKKRRLLEIAGQLLGSTPRK